MIKLSRRFFSTLNKILIVLVLIGVGYFFYVTWTNFTSSRDNYEIQFNYFYIVLSFLTIVVAYVIAFFNWHLLASSFGLKVPLLKEARAWYLSQLGKYVPGKVSLLLLRLDVYKDYSKRVVTLATGIEYVSSLAGACLLVLVAVIFSPIVIPWYIRYVALFFGVFFFVLLYPPFLIPFVNWGFRLLKREPIVMYPSYWQILRFVLIFLVYSLLYGLGFFFLISSVDAIGFEYYFITTGVYQSSVLIGFAAIILPSGIGVREGIIVSVLRNFVALPAVLAASILIRINTALVELMMSGALVFVEKISSKRSDKIGKQSSKSL
jgi:uncharacterized membrane protein YbhN (UPF0104 family)